MVHNDAKPTSIGSRRKWAIALLFVASSCLLLAVSLYRFAWPNVKRYFSTSQVAARQRERYCEVFRKQVDTIKELAIDRIRTLGGRCDKEMGKGNEVFYHIDLSGWRGGDGDLAMLLPPFRLLADDNHLNDPDRFVWLTLDSKATDYSLAFVRDLTNLRRLTVAGTSITDAGLERLDGLAQLWDLNLSTTQISDQSLDDLAGLKELYRLDVSGTRVTATGIAKFTRLNVGVNVRFSGGEASGRRLSFDAIDQTVLKEFVDTECFSIIGTVPSNFSDADLALVTCQHDWVSLNLSESRVTDAGPLKELINLEHLDLQSTQVRELSFMKRLKNLQKRKESSPNQSQLTSMVVPYTVGVPP